MKKFDTFIDEQVSIFFKNIEGRMKPEEMTRIKDTFEFAQEAHKPQTRNTGEPFIIHPIAVARIVGEE